MQAACKGVEDTSNASYEHLTRKLSPPSESKQGTEKVTQFNPLAKMRKAGGRGIAEEEEETDDNIEHNHKILFGLSKKCEEDGNEEKEEEEEIDDNV